MALRRSGLYLQRPRRLPLRAEMGEHARLVSDLPASHSAGVRGDRDTHPLGRLPAVLWITPSAAGEKALILARAGICAEDFEAFSAEIASACYARDAVVLRHRRWAHLLTVEIVRRDEALASPMGLDRLYGRANWVSPRAGRTAREEPDTRSVAAPLPVPREPADHGQRAA